MSLRDRFTDELKTAMRAGEAARVSTLRMITAKLKDSDIAARPGPPIDEAGIIAMLRGMAKSRAESVTMYRQGGREELAAKEEAEIAIIDSFLPQQLDDAAMAAAVDAAVAEAGATSVKEMGKVMAVLKGKYAAVLDMAKAGPMVKARLGG
ncbi:GatB/YqeY domain-containing protein [Neoroseomonas lacus]|uniref:Aspartyl-tRNA amidotransferase subunit B n=1 Tax=Neoroseomonas lacus TaxID=287609 RepID=A0A917K9H5_9PROT|nr:GatB/YqeY domain-containing protein [Neoroseomonas lacus]GGJ05673.1 aspartyl-tRNA amidotransferase subunit B [Neoroseomonas lacus]